MVWLFQNIEFKFYVLQYLPGRLKMREYRATREDDWLSNTIQIMGSYLKKCGISYMIFMEEAQNWYLNKIWTKTHSSQPSVLNHRLPRLSRNDHRMTGKIWKILNYNMRNKIANSYSTLIYIYTSLLLIEKMQYHFWIAKQPA